jgi:hypothetical protein
MSPVLILLSVRLGSEGKLRKMMMSLISLFILNCHFVSVTGGPRHFFSSL